MRESMNRSQGRPLARLVARVALAAAVALVGFITLSGNRRAWADTCPSWAGQRCYAAGSMADIPFGAATGAKANWYLRTVDAPDEYSFHGHAAQILWANTNIEAGEWVEVGNWDGWIIEPPGAWTGYYWGEWVVNWGYYSYRVTSPALGASGTAHTFEVRETYRDASRVVDTVYIDDQEVQASLGSGSVQRASNWIQQIDAGLETTDTSGTVGVTRLNWVKYRDPNGVWQDWVPTLSETTQTIQADTFTWASTPPASAIFATIIPSAPNGVRIIDTFDDLPNRGAKDLPGWDEVVDGNGNNIWVHAGALPSAHIHLDYLNPDYGTYIRRRTGTYNRDLVAQVRFGDDMASQKGTFFGIWASDGTTPLSMGVKTDICPDNYFYRPDNSISSLVCTTIRRTNDWHQFRIFVTATGSWGQIDGIDLRDLGINTSLTPSTSDKMGMAATWRLTGANDNYDEPMLYYMVDY